MDMPQKTRNNQVRAGAPPRSRVDSMVRNQPVRKLSVTVGTVVALLVCLLGTLSAQEHETAKTKIGKSSASKPEPVDRKEAIKEGLKVLGTIIRKEPANVPTQVHEAAIPAARRGLANAVVINPARHASLKTQLRPLLEAEYWLMRAVCDPTKEQRIPIAKAGFRSLNQMVVAYDDWLRKPKRPRSMNGAGQGLSDPSPPDLVAQLRADLLTAARRSLSPQQLEDYLAELKTRDEEEQESLILHLVWLLNRKVNLNNSQEESLTKELMKNWKEEWRLALRQNFKSHHMYMPQFPEEIVKPILSEQQWKLLQTGVYTYTTSIVSASRQVIAKKLGSLDEEFEDSVVDQAFEVKAQP